jgi:hypothetical protein
MYEDLYSKWKDNEGIINVMMNTDMINGPYQLKRNNNNIKIGLQCSFEKKDNKGYTVIKENKLRGCNIVSEYGNIIIRGFKKWAVKYDLNVEINVYENKYERTNKILIVYDVLDFKKDDKNRTYASNVEPNGIWRIKNVGEMTMYTYDILKSS